MLLELKSYLSTKKIANLEELSQHFRLEPSIIRGMLAHWIRKGSVCCRKPVDCGSQCHGCPSKNAANAATEIYQWTA